MIKTGLFALVLTAALPASARAASVIFTNFGPSLAYDVTQGNPVGNDFAGDNAAEGDSFVPTASANFGSVSVALSCIVGCPAADNFVIALTADSTDAPGAVIESFSFHADTLGALGLNNTPITATSVLQPLLTAGTRSGLRLRRPRLSPFPGTITPPPARSIRPCRRMAAAPGSPLQA